MGKISKQEKNEAKKAALETVKNEKSVSEEASTEGPAVIEADPVPFVCPTETIVNNTSEIGQTVEKALNELAAEAEEIEISKVPEALTIDQALEIAKIGEVGNDSTATEEQAEAAIAVIQEKIAAQRATFMDYVTGKTEIPEDMDTESRSAVLAAQKNLPRNIMCKGSHSFCSINEMSRTHEGYSINYLKYKGIIK
jgi:hypothetical protein